MHPPIECTSFSAQGLSQTPALLRFSVLRFFSFILHSSVLCISSTPTGSCAFSSPTFLHLFAFASSTRGPDSRVIPIGPVSCHSSRPELSTLIWRSDPTSLHTLWVSSQLVNSSLALRCHREQCCTETLDHNLSPPPFFSLDHWGNTSRVDQHTFHERVLCTGPTIPDLLPPRQDDLPIASDCTS